MDIHCFEHIISLRLLLEDSPYLNANTSNKFLYYELILSYGGGQCMCAAKVKS